MTEPSPAAKKLACELANAQGGNWQPRHVTPNSSIYALALRLDFEDKVAREIEAAPPVGPWRSELIRSLMLPDPDEELAREIAKDVWVKIGTGGEQEAMEQAALATIKRLREQGRLTDAK